MDDGLSACFELPRCNEFFDVAVPAYQHTIDKNHWKRGPPGPQLEGIALAPIAEIAAVLKVMVLQFGLCEAFLNGFADGVLSHAYHHHAVLADGCQYLFYDFAVMIGHQALNGRVNEGFAQNVSWHGVT